MRRIDLVSDDELERRLAAHLRQGRMPDAFLYIGKPGADNWLSLDSSEEFPIATRLQTLLEQSLPELVECIPGTPNLVSLGVGSGRKERLILEALVRSGSPRYVAVDISAALVDEALKTAADVPVDTTGIVAFVEDLPLIREHWRPPILLCLLGNNFSNYNPDTLLGLVREQMQPDDLFLFDCHLLPASGGKQSVERIYSSRQNALFNMGPLVQRGMRPEDCSFHLELITVDSPAGPACRTHKWLEVLGDAVVSCGSCDLPLSSGSTIELGFTFKHTLPQVEVHLARQGFQLLRTFLSQSGEDALILARPYA